MARNATRQGYRTSRPLAFDVHLSSCLIIVAVTAHTLVMVAIVLHRFGVLSIRVEAKPLVKQLSV